MKQVYSRVLLVGYAVMTVVWLALFVRAALNRPIVWVLIAFTIAALCVFFFIIERDIHRKRARRER